MTSNPSTMPKQKTTYQLLDGKKTSNDIMQELAIEVEKIKKSGGIVPHLAAVLVGNDGASETYVNAKVKACEKIGFKSSLFRYSDTITEKELLHKVDALNKQKDLHGFIVQLPLPSHIDEQKVKEAVSPEKDVDGFHPVNVGKMTLNLPSFISATPYGIIQLLERYNIETSGKNCVVIGRSHIVGLPMSILMARKATQGNCTVTLCHSKTLNIKELTLKADIVIVALGSPEFLTADMVKKGAVVIDVGITKVKDACNKSGYRLAGDVKFDEVAPKCAYITPVPGGVGPMTIAALLMNTLTAARKADIHG